MAVPLLGPLGGGVHQDHEHVTVDGLVLRTAMLAQFLLVDPAGTPE